MKQSLFLLALLVFVWNPLHATEAKRPNVLPIVTDDMTARSAATEYKVPVPL